MKLISMTDFVLEQSKLTGYDISDYDCIIRIVNYAKFLRQPLTLGMFVPCVDNELFNYTIHGNKEQFEQLKEKVLFEGFESVDTRNKDRFQVRLQKANISGSCDTIQNDFAGFYFHDSRNEKSRVKIIEDLLKFHPLELTENALKQIGI